jgi:hypothetical protein
MILSYTQTPPYIYYFRATCTALQAQISAMRQEIDELRNEENEMWFANGQSGALERQKVLDAVHRSKYSWEDVGDAILELLNNDYIWEAIEGRMREGKSRAKRGLQAFYLKASQLNDDDQQILYSTQMLQHQQLGMNTTDETPGSKHPPMLQRKHVMEKNKKNLDQIENMEKKRLEGIEQSVQVDMDTEVDLDEIISSLSKNLNTPETFLDANDGAYEEKKEKKEIIHYSVSVSRRLCSSM